MYGVKVDKEAYRGSLQIQGICRKRIEHHLIYETVKEN